MNFSLKKSNTHAFTLVELIISMLVFTIFIGIISTVYLTVSRSLRHASEVRKVYAEARFLMDRVTQDVRLYTIDYACYEDSADGVIDHGTNLYGECKEIQLIPTEGRMQTLPLISADGMHRVVYRFGSIDNPNAFSVLELDLNELGEWIAADGYYSGFQEFLMDKVAIEDVHFTIWPLKSPYFANPLTGVFEDEYQYQPSVHVVIGARSTSTILPDVVQVLMQSTISSRVYGVNF